MGASSAGGMAGEAVTPPVRANSPGGGYVPGMLRRLVNLPFSVATRAAKAFQDKQAGQGAGVSLDGDAATGKGDLQIQQ